MEWIRLTGMTWVEWFDQWVNSGMAGLGWPLEGVTRLALAAAAGGIIGIEREARVRHAGFRTMMLVSVGSCLAMLVSIRFAYHGWPAVTAEGVRTAVDPGRIAYGIMGGVGFLGAGTIIQQRSRARGLTTAAGIWCVAALGMAFGFGQYVLAIASTAVVLAALWALNYAKLAVPTAHGRMITVRTARSPAAAAELSDWIGKQGGWVKEIGYDVVPGDDGRIDIDVLVGYRGRGESLSLERAMDETAEYEVRASREA